MRTLFILICTIIYICSFFIDVTFLGYSVSSPLYTRFTYMFAHTSFVHFIMNMISFHFLFTILKYKVNQLELSITMIIGAIVATICSVFSITTVGASGVVFVLFGIYTVLYPSKKLFLYISIMVLINIVAFYFLHTNPLIHLFAYLYGVVYMIIRKYLIK